jgi:hypothetical protein
MSSGMPLTRNYTTGLVSLINETTDTINAQNIAPVTVDADLSLDANGTGDVRLGYNGGGTPQNNLVYGDIIQYKPVNDANPQYHVGSSATNRGTFQAVYDSGAQTLDYLKISTDSAAEGDIVLIPNGVVGINTTDLDGTPAVGQVTVKGSTNDGSTNCLMLRDSDEANVAWINTDGYLHLEDGAYIAGKTVEVATTNKSQVYIEDSAGEVLTYQNYYWNGAAFVASSGYNFGHYAGQNCSGLNCINNGLFAGRYCSGDYCNNFGRSAGQNCSGDYCINFGRSAGQYCSGDYCNNFGTYAGQYCSGNSCNNFGNSTGHNCIGDFCNNFGYSAGQNCTGDYCINNGRYAGRYIEGDNNIAFGNNAWASFLDNVGGNKTFDNTDINVGSDQITVTGHSFGANGTYCNLKYTEGTSPITGITDGDIIQAYIVDANTVQVDRTHDITAAGSGVGHTLTPQYKYTNTMVFGGGQDPTASNQIILGNSSVTQTILRGGIIESTESITSESGGIAASLDVVQTHITTNGDSDLDNVTLADGTVGQVKKFIIKAVGNVADSVKITPATMVGGTQITFAANPLGLGCEMEYTSAGWVVSGNNGGTIA